MRSLSWGIGLGLMMVGASALATPVKPVPSSKSPLATAAKSPGLVQPAIPTTRLQLGTNQANIPDWSKISFASLPPLAAAGSLGELHWQPGQRLEHLLTLSDFQDTFRLQDLDFYAIAVATQHDPKTVSLSQFKLIYQQSLADLVSAVPDLGKMPVSSVRPIESLLRSAKPDYQLDELTPLSVVVQDPTLGTLTFNHFDLSIYNLTDIPGLLQTPLVAFVGWQNAQIIDIPGLSQMPWSQFITLPETDAAIGTVQLPDADEPPGPAISGSERQGFQVNCPTLQDCPGISFTGNSEIEDKRWIAGSAQMVMGGTGALAQLNGGLEPTGRHPYGAGFKWVLTDVTPEQIQSALYFERCQRPSPLLPTSCSPYAIGPVPFQSLRPGDPMLVGTVDSDAPNPDQAIDFAAPLPAAPVVPARKSGWQEWLSQILNTFESVFHLG